jgi:hypothetical protein
VDNVHFSGDGRILAMTIGTTFILKDADTGKELHRLKDLDVSALHFDKQGKSVQVWHPRHGMAVVNVGTGKLGLLWNPTIAMNDTTVATFSPDGRKLLLLSAGSSTTRAKLLLCNTTDGKDLKHVSNMGGQSYSPLVAFSSDGRFFADADGPYNSGIRWWEPATLKERKLSSSGGCNAKEASIAGTRN